MSSVAVLSEMDSLEIPADVPSLAAAVRNHDRNEARLCMSVAEFDTNGLWDIAGSTSAHAWLVSEGMHRSDAWEMVKLARKLRRLSVTAAAWVGGVLSGGQVRIIASFVVDRHTALFAEHEAELVPSLSDLTVNETLRVMRLWRDRADALNPGKGPGDEPCTAHLSQTMDDRGILNATLDAEGYALWHEALRLADSDDFDTPAAQRRGESFKAIAKFFVANQDMKTPRRHTPHIKVILDASTLGTDHLHGYDEATGMTLPPETLERILCDCTMHRVVMADGVVLDYGRAVKDPPPELAHAVAARDQGCRWPQGCNRPAGWCDVHHVREWIKHFGPTAIWNLVLLCSKHHDMLHRRGWTAKLHANGDFEVTSPWRQTWVSHPPGALQQRIRPPGDQEVADVGSPAEDHLIEFELVYAAQRRLINLRGRAQTGRAIASLTRLTGCAA